MTKRAVAILVFVQAFSAVAQIRVDPATVNVNAQGASTVFLSYGSLRPDQYSVEALWCGGIVPANPDIGSKCDPASTWGRLPLRNDLTRPSGSAGFTDIMTIPQNVIRRAYERAARGAVSSFYYVRRFSSIAGKPDEYIAILCRMAGRGATVPLALTGVKLRFATDKEVLSTPVGQPPPPLHAELTYTGTGRLIGRWEVVMPGEEPPSPQDLVPEASLPIEQRVAQRRYTQLERFNIFLSPLGTYRLEGPDVSKLPTAIEGLYQVLLRVEASDDSEGNTDLAVVGAGSGIVSSGGVAGFPLPALRYYVGSIRADGGRADVNRVTLVRPILESAVAAGERIEFEWRSTVLAPFYRLDLNDASGAAIISAIIEAPITKYRAPPLVGERAAAGKLTWSVVALNADGTEITRSPVGTFRYGVSDETSATIR
ncbi:MAG TPA: hypothetical protein VGS96_13250 [Thermoanaerobaculia bacterium]|nr:hypothetical protein [Thermoanaerobaculia bacterium]